MRTGLFILIFIALSCAQAPVRQLTSEPSKPLKFCAAVRGNGELAMAHMTSLARLTESYGVLDGIAGGSSASITSFLYESILMNPAVNICSGGRKCSERERARRVATLLKSLEQYLSNVKRTDAALAMKGLFQLSEAVKAKRIAELLKEGGIHKASEELRTLLNSKTFKNSINPEIFEMLKKGRVKQVYEQITNLRAFKAEDASIFFRPGLFNFNKMPDIIGRVADFYAGRGPANEEKMRTFLNKCATQSHDGKMWGEMKAGKKCGENFDSLFEDFEAKYETAGDFKHRMDDPIGGELPALISTSILEGRDLVQKYEENRAEFWRTTKPKYDFDVPFDRVKFGYWGRPSDLKRVAETLSSSEDLKSKKFLPLGPANSKEAGWTRWKEALRTSPAEPGLAAIQPIDENRVSAGGWSDLHPVQVLKAMGCENVVYVTRQGEESKFAVGVARLLGLTPKDEQMLYSLETDPESPSSFQEALKQADAVYCTDWNKFSLSQQEELLKNGYEAELVTQSAFFERPQGVGPKKISRTTQLIGCSPTARVAAEPALPATDQPNH